MVLIEYIDRIDWSLSKGGCYSVKFFYSASESTWVGFLPRKIFFFGSMNTTEYTNKKFIHEVYQRL